ncbi:MAG: indolepyruvate oxidoreductase subunit beta [Anaerolineae bacterium]|nr:indolepyruvate oxidoreductase subunit beta [Anaerolineae bacterium]MDW8102365.1 indolepyruvate oxidoreductase subunit beta [Anaerolineae bacterium]
MAPLNFVLVGVGGQGTILASDILTEVGLRAGYDAKKAEVHGMAQRGGSVITHIRWGEKVYSPLIGKGEAHFLLALEKLEALRYVEFLRPGGTALVNDHAIPPVAVNIGAISYPDDERIKNTLSQVAGRILFIPALRKAEELGDARVTNIILLGALSSLLDVPEEVWQKVLERRVPQRYLELNLKAFQEGRKLI